MLLLLPPRSGASLARPQACCSHPLTLPPRAASVGAGIPSDFLMRNTTKFADPMLAFADKGGELGAAGG